MQKQKLLPGKGSNNSKGYISVVKIPSPVSVVKTSLKRFAKLFCRIQTLQALNPQI